MAKGDRIDATHVGKYPVVALTIQQPGDVGFDKKLNIPDDHVIIFGAIQQAFVLRGAMASGKAVVTLYFEMEGGLHVAMETSAAMLKQIADIAASFVDPK